MLNLVALKLISTMPQSFIFEKKSYKFGYSIRVELRSSTWMSLESKIWCVRVSDATERLGPLVYCECPRIPSVLIKVL